MSGRNTWATPKLLWDKLNKEFRFTLDVCATMKNRKCGWYLSSEFGGDGLTQDWTKVNFGTTPLAAPHVCWCNPPYTDDAGKPAIGRWLGKCYQTAQQGTQCVAIVVNDCSTKWWHDWAVKAAEVRYLIGGQEGSRTGPFRNGRVRFVGSKSGPTHSQVVLVYSSPVKVTLETAPGQVQTFKRQRQRKVTYWDWKNNRYL